MFRVERSDLERPRGELVRLRKKKRALRWAEVLDGWIDDTAFSDAFTDALAQSRFAAFFWETPPVDQKSLAADFEMVLVDAPTLAAMSPSPHAFAEWLEPDRGTDRVRSFANLGGDALLVAPCANGPLASYTHLAAFVRSAGRLQVRKLWNAVGEGLRRRLADSAAPAWLSTSGLGVPWVHVRVDDTPKYYTYPPYRQRTGADAQG